MSKNNGGPAFPVPNLQDDEDFNGMTMRDYFAAKAMQGIMAGILGDGGDWPNREIIVANAYTTADSMLAERAK